MHFQLRLSVLNCALCSCLSSWKVWLLQQAESCLTSTQSCWLRREEQRENWRHPSHLPPRRSPRQSRKQWPRSWVGERQEERPRYCSVSLLVVISEGFGCLFKLIHPLESHDDLENSGSARGVNSVCILCISNRSRVKWARLRRQTAPPRVLQGTVSPYSPPRVSSWVRRSVFSGY